MLVPAKAHVALADGERFLLMRQHLRKETEAVVIQQIPKQLTGMRGSEIVRAIEAA